MSPDLCPLLLEPRFLPKPWGGRRLQALGKALPEGAIGESWELYDDASGSARVAAGPAQGLDLRGLSAAWGSALLGPGREGWAGNFPLLVKLLDAREDLSVQVHPDDALALRLHGPGHRGKSEMWVVLEAAHGARLLSGFRPGVDRPAFEAALASGRVMELLNQVPVSAGDVLDIPAGRVHAIGGGCLVAEVQQNCDLTYRVWDYGRLEGGKPRALHLEQALQALRFDAPFAQDSGLRRPQPQARPFGAEALLVEGPYFRVRRLSLRRGLDLPPAAPAPRILLPLRGRLRLVWAQEPGMMVPQMATALVPAALAARALPEDGEAEALLIEAL